jgi:hypothetical protein
MPNCPRCNKPTTTFTRSLISGLCADCRNVEAEKAREKRDKAREKSDEEWRRWRKENEESDEEWRRQQKECEERLEEERKAERAERVWGLTHGREEPGWGPLNGLILIGISAAIALLSWAMIASGESAGSRVGFVGLVVACAIYLAGVIRWAVSGAQIVHLDRLQRQNREIIDLLELIADKRDRGAELDSIRALGKSGRLAEEEFRRQRRQLLRG